MKRSKLETIIDEFLNELKSEGKSENTLKNYTKHLEKVITFCKKNNIDIETWNGKETRLFRNWLIEQGYKPATINTILSTLSSLFNYCVEENYIKGNPITPRAFVKETNRTVRFLTDDDLKKLNEIFQEIPEHIALVFQLQLATGLRISEAVSVKAEDILIIDSKVFLRVLGKGNKERIVPVMNSEIAQKILQLKEEKKQGRIFDVEKSTVLWWAWRIKKEHNIDFTSHKLRHTVATKLLGLNVTIDVVQQVLGHASISTTRRYAKTSDENIKKLAVKVL